MLFKESETDQAALLVGEPHIKCFSLNQEI